MREFELDCIIGFLVVMIIVLIIYTIVCSQQLQECKNNESPYCPVYVCDTPNNDGTYAAVRNSNVCKGTTYSLAQ